MAGSIAALPLAPGALPMIGHLLPLARDPLGFITDLRHTGPLVRLQLGPHPLVMVYDPALVRHVLLNPRTFDKHGPMWQRAREVTGSGLASCPHAEHKRLRTLVQPSFHPARITAYAARVTDATNSLLAGWQNGSVIDLGAQMMDLVTQATVANLFGTDMPEAVRAAVAADLNTLIKGFLPRAFAPSWITALPLPANRRHQAAATRLRAVLADVITTRRADKDDRSGTGSGGERDDLLDALIGSGSPSDPPGSALGLSDEELTDQVVTFHGAGVESAAYILTWALALLAAHPDAEARVHDEVDRVLADGAPAHEHLDDLPYLGQVITETLRLYSSGWFLTRTTTHITELAGVQLPAGTIIGFSTYAIHRQGAHFPDPECFDPDRWSQAPDRTTYIPFGTGPRKCIGDRLALAEATTALATITRTARLIPVNRDPLRARAAMLLHPRRVITKAVLRRPGERAQRRA
ncbi:cytochrome P450 [Streptomyces roseoverticillatus]|uniref:cytochrome P450 n=1 Tax=Streptomyces roseoverticillatus TaxID=66429 RepID=UPI0033E4BFE4